MMEPLEIAYFNWLCSKVSNVPMSDIRFYRLFHVLHQTEYVWTVVGDDNRAEDGTDLRIEFLHEAGIDNDGRLFERGCSVLEMLIAFSRRASFDTDDGVDYWFWVMINNLASAHTADILESDPETIQFILETFIWRNYDRRGNGGLFPMRRTRNDQRKIEVAYQFSEYLLESSHV